MVREEHFDAGAAGLRCFDEDEFEFVGQDHRKIAEARLQQLADASGFRQAAERTAAS